MVEEPLVRYPEDCRVFVRKTTQGQTQQELADFRHLGASARATVN